MFEKFKELQLILLGVVLSLAFIIVAVIFANNLSRDNISVTGAAFEIVKSDSAAWTLNIETKASSKLAAYKTIKAQIPIVKKYLISAGIADSNIDVSLPNSYPVYRTNNNGYSTSEIAYYNFSQPIKIKSDDVELIKKISTESQLLLEQGINVSSNDLPEYQYSKLADLKIELLEKATADARNRAKSMLKSNHNRIGKIRSAKMGVFQITPVESNSVSDMGINDLSSIEKKVTAVANVVFAIK